MGRGIWTKIEGRGGRVISGAARDGGGGGSGHRDGGAATWNEGLESGEDLAHCGAGTGVEGEASQ